MPKRTKKKKGVGMPDTLMTASTPPARTAEISRSTGETRISLALALDGESRAAIVTGFGMLDHMLALIAFWGGFDLSLRCEGDLHVDAHHTVEDVGLCLGQAFLQALGDRKGIARTAWARVPMDEALAEVAVDLSGRPWLEWRGDELLPPVLAHQEKDLWREFYKAFASAGRFNAHIEFRYGKNGHHLLESAAKGMGIALRDAVWRVGSAIPSTKGSLD